MLAFSPGLPCKSNFFVLGAARPATAGTRLRGRLVNPNKCTIGRTRRAGQHLPGQFRVHKTTQKMPLRQQLQEEHPTRLAIRMLGLLPTATRLPLSGSQKSEGTKGKSPTGPCKPRRLVSFFHFFSKKNCGSFRKIIACNSLTWGKEGQGNERN